MITGIDLDLHKEEYIRRYVPEFVDRRTLSDVRPDLQENLERLGMDWNDRFEFMVRNRGRCGGSQITVERIPNDGN